MNYNWLTPKAQARLTPGKGQGSFVVEKINRGELVASFGGYVVSDKDLIKFPKDRRARSLQLSQDRYLLSGPFPEPGDMINHSCDPNCGISGTSSVVAIIDIEIGMELTFDYAMTDSSEYDEFDCNCGSQNCRKKIGGEDWLNINLQQKYKNNFSLYISKLIEFSHSKRF